MRNETHNRTAPHAAVTSEHVKEGLDTINKIGKKWMIGEEAMMPDMLAAIGPADDPDAVAGKDGLVAEFVIDPQAQRRGHGSRLLNAVADTLRTDGFVRATWWIPTTDDPLRQFDQIALVDMRDQILGGAGAQRVGIQIGGGLQAFTQVRTPSQRDADQQRAVDQQRPQRAMGQRIRAGDAEQRLRCERSETERTVGDDVGTDPTRRRQLRQQQSVEPDREATGQAPGDTGQAGVAPVQRSDHGWRKLGDCAERQQAVACQRPARRGRVKDLDVSNWLPSADAAIQRAARISQPHGVGRSPCGANSGRSLGIKSDTSLVHTSIFAPHPRTVRAIHCPLPSYHAPHLVATPLGAWRRAIEFYIGVPRV